ncbi:MAG TPA: DUF5615 family PIN-like protein [Dyadobacter sp.]|jgi:predicted nuclease of predicted toxin-antitoxin system|nr:DUF5615 family PIN-like protein [Dyadobacter sp.]
MRLLIDQNISHRILPIIEEHFDNVQHVRQLGLLNTNDHEIFMFGRNQGFEAIITLDDDFVKLLNLFSSPPKIIWLRTGNCATLNLAEILISKYDIIKEFIESEEHLLFEIFKM